MPEYERRNVQSERPETAPMFTRSQQRVIMVPQSGRPRVESRY